MKRNDNLNGMKFITYILSWIELSTNDSDE